MYISFTLTMPNNNSWNGRWSGEEKLYVRVKNLGRTKKAEKQGSELLGGYYYNFGDGWGANVQVEEIDAAKARKLRRISDGFCGYDWMIESIIHHGEIKI